MARYVSATGSHMVAWFDVTTGQPYVGPPQTAVAQAPAMSADGQWLVYSSDARPGFSDLVVHGGAMQYRRLPVNPLSGWARMEQPRGRAGQGEPGA